MKKTTFAILLGCLTVLSTTYAQKQKVSIENNEAQALPSSKIPIDPKVKIGKLDNGLTYYIRNNGKPEDKLELRLVINAGSILEDDDQLGLAHFMEHMNFNGSKNFEKNDIVDYLQSIGVKFGADLNAYTSFDETVYILPIPSDDAEKLEKGFQILEDWAFNALLTEKDIDEERGVVLEEYRLGLGADERMRQRYLPKIMYGSKYAERLPIGTKEILENFDYETLRRYYKDWYRPGLMAVVAVGDLDVETIEKKIKDHFGKAEKTTTPRLRPTFEMPNHEETFIAIESDKEASFTQVQVLYKDKENAPLTETIGDYRDNMIEGLFSQMINNRLQELADGANPPFVYGFSYHGGTWARTKEAYQSFAMTKETGQLDALKALLTENERVKRFGFQQGEFDRAKKDILARMERSYNDRDKQESNRIIGQYVNHFLERNPIPGIEWSFQMYQQMLPTIQLEEVNTLINNFLHEDNRVIVLTGPEKEGLKKTTEAEVLNLMKAIENDKNIQPYEDEAIRASLIAEKPEPGSIVDETTNETLDITTFTLSNGAKVTYKKTDFKNDEILFDSFSFGGSSLYGDEEFSKMAYAFNGLSEAGVDGLNKTDMGKMMSGKIVRVSPYVYGISEGLRGSASPKDLETLFQMVHLYFTKLNYDEEAFGSYIAKQKGFLSNLLSNPNTYFGNEFNKFMNEGNARFLGFPTAELLDKQDYKMAYDKYQERFSNAGDFHFYFVGNVDEAKLKEYAKTYIATLPSNSETETYKVTDFRPRKGMHEVTINKGTDPKSSVRIYYQGETRYDPKEAFALRGLGDILTIKLIEKLREEEGGVYGVGARGSMSKLPYGSYRFTISFPCGPDNVEKLKTAALAEVTSILENGPTQKDLDKIKEALLLDYKENSKKNRFWLNNIKNKDYQERPILNSQQFEAKVAALSADDIQKVAQKYLTENRVIGILMPEE